MQIRLAKLKELKNYLKSPFQIYLQHSKHALKSYLTKQKPKINLYLMAHKYKDTANTAEKT